MISQDIFLRVNGISEKSGQKGVPHKCENEHLPLKVFIKCSDCHVPFTGYIVKKKNLYYYKCRTRGCKSNRNAQEIHTLFLDELNKLQVREDLIEPIVYEAEYGFEELNKENKGRESLLKGRITEINASIDKLEEKFFIKEEMNRETYNKLMSKYQNERKEVQGELDQCYFDSSNAMDAFRTLMEYCRKLTEIWEKGEISVKEKLQKMIFPQGIIYDKKNKAFRIPEINYVIAEIARRSGDLALNEEGPTVYLPGQSHFVPGRGQKPNS